MTAEEIAERVDIVDFIGQYVDLTEKNGEYWGLSPFKEERTPSFSVRRETGEFYDFSSGFGGGVITFARRYFRCSYADALSILESYAAGRGGVCGAAPPRLAASSVCRRFGREKRPRAGEKRKPIPADYMEVFERRPDKLAVWEREGISRETLELFDVRYDAVSNRIVYPIRGLSGEIVNVGGRTLAPDWRERGIRKYTYYFGWEGGVRVLYGLFENGQAIREAGEVILFEGCKSVLLARTWGISNTAALLTCHLNPAQLKILAALGARVVFALDKEVRVRDDKAACRLKSYVDVEYLWDFEDLLAAKESPVDRGRAVFERLYAARLRL